LKPVLIVLLPMMLAVAAPAAGPSNAITISDLGGNSGKSRPFTISRFFARGDIRHFAAARIDGTVAMTQCDVKTRWPDGSVQHALVSFFAPVGRDETLTVDFVDQPAGNNDHPLGSAEMLRLDYWGAEMEAAAAGVAKSADARAMLRAGSWRYWLRGPVCTQVIVEGRRDGPSSAFAYDFGWRWDGKNMALSDDPKFRSLHPIFVLTFYRNWPGAKIECILENDWTTKLQDQRYSLKIYEGNPAPRVVYRNPAVIHLAKTRWRKVFWSGEQPPPVSVDYNLPYLIYSRVLPNYDLTRVVPASAIAEEAAAFQRTDRGDISGRGQWEPVFPRPGGRPDIGLFPRWYVRYLFTFDPQLYEVMLGDAAVSGHVPIHYREAAAGRPFRRGSQTGAFGRVLSIDARPTVRTTYQTQDTRPEDAITPAGPATAGPWVVDLAHQASFAFIPYLITGDWYYLEELHFWAAYDLARGNPGVNVSYGRHAAWGFINDGEEIRGVAWGLRNLAHAALAAPDGSPEKAYFTEKLRNNIAIREGKYNITGGEFYRPCQTYPYDGRRETSMWCWGRQTAEENRNNPLHFLDGGSPGLRQGLDESKVYAGSSPWMWNYNQIVLGYLNELGFPVRKLHETLAKNLINQLQNPDYNPYLAAAYRIPVRKQQGAYIGTWAEVRRGYANPGITGFRASDSRDVEHGYGRIVQAAASFLPGIVDGRLTGKGAWEWINTNLGEADLLNNNPKWALVPRRTGPELAVQAAERSFRAAEIRRQRQIRLAGPAALKPSPLCSN